MTDSTVEIKLLNFKYYEEGIFSQKKADYFFKVAHADFLSKTKEYASEQEIGEAFKM